jgi:hypothetical protein
MSQLATAATGISIIEYEGTTYFISTKGKITKGKNHLDY